MVRTGHRLHDEVLAPRSGPLGLGLGLVRPIHQVARIFGGDDDGDRELVRVLEGREEALVFGGQALAVHDHDARAVLLVAERVGDRVLLPALAGQRDLEAFAPDQLLHGLAEALRPLRLLRDHHEELVPVGDHVLHALDRVPLLLAQFARLLRHALHPI